MKNIPEGETKERKFSLIITKTIPQETGFPRLKFFTAYDSQVFFRIFTFHIRFDDLFLYVCIIHENQGPQYERNYIIAKELKRDELGMLFQSSPKMNRKLITRRNLHTVKVDHTRPVSLKSPSKFCSQRFFFFFNHWTIQLF